MKMPSEVAADYQWPVHGIPATRFNGLPGSFTGLVNDQGYSNFFGLDQASMRMGFDWSRTTGWLASGEALTAKRLDAYFKYAPFLQSTGREASPHDRLVRDDDGRPALVRRTRTNYFHLAAGLFLPG